MQILKIIMLIIIKNCKNNLRFNSSALISFALDMQTHADLKTVTYLKLGLLS